MSKKYANAETLRYILGDPHPKASGNVKRVLTDDLGESLADGLAAISEALVQRRPSEKPYHFIDLWAGERKVQLSVSPSGGSVRIYVDGEEV